MPRRAHYSTSKHGCVLSHIFLLIIENNSLTSRLSEQPGPQRSRFSFSLKAYQAAQYQFIQNQRHGIVPDLESYLELRRDLSGLGMIFDMIEHAEGLQIPHEAFEDPVIRKLKQYATDIVAWSAVSMNQRITSFVLLFTVGQDIVSFNLDQSRGNNHNLVSILISERHLSVQTAIHCAGNMVMQSIDAFLATERFIPVMNSLDVPLADDVRLYIQGLRDIIVGSIHWNYETELYFGSKGDEVRRLRWTFLIDA
jgi:Terpene synthase family 2, C-terminal metal binding